MTQERINKLIATAKNHGIDCVAVMPGANMAYLTGLSFHLSERSTLALFPTTGDPALVLPALEAAKPEAGPVAIDWRLFPWTDEEGPANAFKQACEALGLSNQTLAVEELTMRVKELKLLKANTTGVKLAAAEPLLADLRMRKDESELASMRRAVEITEAALTDTLEKVRTGMTEKDVAGELQVACLRYGAESLPFEPIVLVGANTALPHGRPGTKVVRGNQLLLFDFGVSVNGYASDITRTFAVGEIEDEELKRIYKIVQDANEAGRAATRPGVQIQEIDRAARKVINEAGYKENFTHRLGHGLGLDVHEGPYAREGDTTVLEPGMVFTVEPGIYIPGKGGVRIEDDVVVTADGCESLTTFDRQLRVLAV
jgi:Xaa-Pro dipeptidase